MTGRQYIIKHGCYPHGSNVPFINASLTGTGSRRLPQMSPSEKWNTFRNEDKGTYYVIRFSLKHDWLQYDMTYRAANANAEINHTQNSTLHCDLASTYKYDSLFNCHPKHHKVVLYAHCIILRIMWYLHMNNLQVKILISIKTIWAWQTPDPCNSIYLIACIYVYIRK